MARFDTVILGAGAAGCATAAVLAKAGKRVLVMDREPAPGGSSSSLGMEGLRLSGWPLCYYGLEEGGAWNVLLQEVGMRHYHERKAIPYQVALPDKRITVSAESNAMFEELRREFPKEIDQLQRMYRDANNLKQKLARSKLAAYLARKRKAGEFLKRYGLGREVLAFYSAVSLTFFGLSIENMSLSHFILQLTTLPGLSGGGIDRTAGEFCEFVVRHGGECRFGDPWPEIILRRKHFGGLRTKEGLIEAKSVVMNIPWGAKEKTLFALVNEDVVPVGMVDTVLYVRDYERPQDTVLVSLAARGLASASGRGLQALTAFFPNVAGGIAAPEDLIGELVPLVPFLPDFTMTAALRDSRERSLDDPLISSWENGQRNTGAGINGRLAVRDIYVIEDTPFGIVQQAEAVLSIARRLV